MPGHGLIFWGAADAATPAADAEEFLGEQCSGHASPALCEIVQGSGARKNTAYVLQHEPRGGRVLAATSQHCASHNVGMLS